MLSVAGRAVGDHKCAAPPGNWSTGDDRVHDIVSDLSLDGQDQNVGLNWSIDDVHYSLHNASFSPRRSAVGQCQISLATGTRTRNRSGDTDVMPCLYGYEYNYARELSFKTEVLLRLIIFVDQNILKIKI